MKIKIIIQQRGDLKIEMRTMTHNITTTTEIIHQYRTIMVTSPPREDVDMRRAHRTNV